VVFYQTAIVKHFQIFIQLLAMASLSCNKMESINKTYIGNLPIVTTSTPTTALVGQNIISNVRCQLTSMSGALIFQGFEIKEETHRQYNISAKALYQDWNTQIALMVIFTLDTTSSIKATSTGKYILNFYNAAQIVKSDTVQVN
jgi:hypothetical protein